MRRGLRVDIINWVKIWIRTRDDNKDDVSGVTATLVPLQTTKQQSTYANSNKSTNISSATLSLSYWMPLSWHISAYNSSL